MRQTYGLCDECYLTLRLFSLNNSRLQLIGGTILVLFY